jgi:hypothetical protein
MLKEPAAQDQETVNPIPLQRPARSPQRPRGPGGHIGSFRPVITPRSTLQCSRNKTSCLVAHDSRGRSRDETAPGTRPSLDKTRSLWTQANKPASSGPSPETVSGDGPETNPSLTNPLFCKTKQKGSRHETAQETVNPLPLQRPTGSPPGSPPLPRPAVSPPLPRPAVSPPLPRPTISPPLPRPAGPPPLPRPARSLAASHAPHPTCPSTLPAPRLTDAVSAGTSNDTELEKQRPTPCPPSDVVGSVRDREDRDEMRVES